MELEERLRCTEDEVRKAIHARLQTEEALKMMEEQVRTHTIDQERCYTNFIYC